MDGFNRVLFLALLSGVPWFGAGAAEAQELEIFGGGGLVLEDVVSPVGAVGANVWMARRWGAGVSLWANDRYGVVPPQLWIRYKVRVGRTELHVGASPVWFDDGVQFLPSFDVTVGGKIHRRFGARFGMSVGVGEGAYFHPMGLAFWSFD